MQRRRDRSRAGQGPREAPPFLSGPDYTRRTVLRVRLVNALASVPDLEHVDEQPSREHGSCDFGGWECPKPAEVQVSVPDVAGDRLLCRGHVGFYMLTVATGGLEFSDVLVRRLAPMEGALGPSLVRRAS